MFFGRLLSEGRSLDDIARMYSESRTDQPNPTDFTQYEPIPDEVIAPVETGSRRVSSSSKKRNWSTNEDIQLCRSWLNVGIDPHCQYNQTQNTFWERCFHDYSLHMPTDRKAEGLRHRWQTIKHHIGKFSGIMAKVEMENASGTMEDDKMKKAKECYNDVIQSKFNLEHCYHELRGQPKFAPFVDNVGVPGKGKRFISTADAYSSPRFSTTSSNPTHLDDHTISLDDDTPFMGARTDAAFERPIGTKVAKEQRKRGKGKSVAQSEEYKSSALADYQSKKVEMHEASMRERMQEREVRRRREILREKDREEVRQRYLEDKARADYLQRQEDRRYMAMDTSQISETQAEFFRTEQEYIQNKYHGNS